MRFLPTSGALKSPAILMNYIIYLNLKANSSTLLLGTHLQLFVNSKINSVNHMAVNEGIYGSRTGKDDVFLFTLSINTGE